MRTSLVAPLATLVLLAGACGAPDADDGGPPPDETADGESDAAGSDALLGDEVQAAIDELVARTGVDRSEVLVVTTELVTWPDGALGCPEPDRAYTQALVDGYRIELEAGGELTAYHGASGDAPFPCENPEPPVG